MNSSYQSPFKPKFKKNYIPKNIKIYTFNAGFKKKNDDLLLVEFNKPANISAVYSKTSTPSAPIIWDKKNNKGNCKILVVNSGNANAHTGKKGIIEIDKYVNRICKFFKCKKNEILVSSTGVIGEQLSSDKIIKTINKIKKESKTKNILDAAKAIMTTDTFPKTYYNTFISNGKKEKVFGFAKGSGMIAPNMGTMLAYIFIETSLNKKDLKKILNENLTSTFNSITVDGDTSTSDTVMLFSINNKTKNKVSKNLLNKISKSVKLVMENLSKQIVSDGEGISKLIEVNVNNALSNYQAKNVAFSIAESLLVKTAIAGEDANWGRIVMAIGKADNKIKQNKITIKFDKFVVAKNGSMYSKININKINKYMKNKIIKINIDLGIGNFSKRVWSTDLTHKYLNINADYRS